MKHRALQLLILGAALALALVVSLGLHVSPVWALFLGVICGAIGADCAMCIETRRADGP